MSTKDVIKSSIYENLTGGGDLTVASILLILATAAIVGIYIYAVYKLSSKAAFYSKDLNITIAGLPVVVAAIMVAMQSNLIVSLGMVGALSIVRFRNAIKNPLDLLYLFWTISAGIICGVGLKLLAIILCIVMTVLILILQLLPNSKGAAILILKTKEDNIDWEEINDILNTYAKCVKEKSNSYRYGETEVIYEIKSSKKTELLASLKKHKELQQINFLEHDGEYRI